MVRYTFLPYFQKINSVAYKPPTIAHFRFLLLIGAPIVILLILQKQGENNRESSVIEFRSTFP